MKTLPLLTGLLLTVATLPAQVMPDTFQRITSTASPGVSYDVGVAGADGSFSIVKAGTGQRLTIDASGNVTVLNNLTVNGTFTANNFAGGAVTGGASGLMLNAGGTDQNVTLAPSGTGVVAIPSRLTITSTTPSTSATTGSFYTAGGAGISGNTWVDGYIAIGASAEPGDGRTKLSIGGSDAADTNIVLRNTSTGGEAWQFRSHGSAATGAYAVGDFSIFTDAAFNGHALHIKASDGRVILNSTTASTSPATGSLILNGGVGVAGAGYFGGLVNARKFVINGDEASSATGGTGLFAGSSSHPDGFGSLILSSRHDGARPILFVTHNGSSQGERMRITSAGNVGIGTTAPGDKLHVEATGDTTLRIKGVGTGGRAQLILDSPSGAWQIEDAAGGGAGNHPPGALGFTESGVGPRVTVLKGGNVGIGTTSPAAKLDVAGAAKAQSLAVTATTAATSTTTGALTVAGGAGVAGDVVVGGNLGIGVVPGSSLHVLQNARIQGNLTVDGTISLASGNVVANTTSDTLHITSTTDSTGYAEGAATVAGGVGIAKNLHVGQGITAAGTVNAAAVQVGGQAVWHAGNFTPSNYLQQSGGVVNGGTSGLTINAGATDQSLVLDSDGTGRVEVRDTLAITNATGIQHLLMGNQDASGTNSPAILRAANGAFEFGRGDSWTGQGGTFVPSVAIAGNGYVGVGTTAPDSPLTVVRDPGLNADTILHLRNANTTQSNIGSALVLSGAAGGKFNAIAGVGDGRLHFYTNEATVTGHQGSTPKMVIRADGNVSIGTTTPSDQAKLQVEGGKLLVRSTSNNWGQLQVANPNNAEATISISAGGTGSPGNDSTYTHQWVMGLSPYGVGMDRFSITNKTLTSAAPFTILNASGNVGIGTTSPGRKLEVNSDLGITAGEKFIANFTQSTGQNGIFLGYRANGTTVTSALIRADNDLPITLGTSATNEAVTILNSGNVGIGTTSPGYRLDIQSGSMNLANVLYFKGSSNGSAIYQDGSNNRMVFQNTQSKGYDFQYAGIGVGVGADVPAGSIYAAGSLGIGTTNPVAKLTLRAAEGAAGGMRLQHSDDNGPLVNIYQAAGDGSIDLYSGENPTVLRTHLSSFGHTYFNPNGGNVGIGTTTPTAKLDVAGNGRIGGDLSITASATVTGQATFNGNVGVGTSAPFMKLQVNNGNLAVTGANGGVLHLANNYDTDVWGVRVAGIDNGNNGHDLGVLTRTTAGGAFQQSFTVKSDGTTAVSGNLRMLSASGAWWGFANDGGSFSVFRESTTGGGRTAVATFGLDDSVAFSGRVSVAAPSGASDAATRGYVDDNNPWNWELADVTLKDPNDWLGLGVVSPAAPLHVQTSGLFGELARFGAGGQFGNLNLRSYITLQNQNPSYWWEFSVQNQQGTGGGENGFALRSKHALEDASKPRLYVGEGVPVSANQRSFMRLYNQNPASGWEFSVESAAGNGTGNGFALREHYQSVTGSPALYVAENSGHVGLGTTQPGTYRLAVNGAIRAREVVIENTGWADYVFADDYELTPLADVEAHIREKKHLPGVPSAQEVAAKGVNLGEMQATLLAKVEELTLHLIAQQKEIAALREQVADLKAVAQP